MAMTPAARRALMAAVSKKVKCENSSVTTWSRGQPLGATALGSGLLYYDISIGIGGVPEGRMIMHHGPTGCGKTTLKWIIAAQIQRAGGVVYSADFERKDELSWAARCGVALEDTDEVLGLRILKSRSIEDCFDHIEKEAKGLREGGFDTPIFVMWDSFQSAGSRRTFDAGQLEGGFAPETLAYSRGLKIFTPVMDDHKVTVIGNSQVRANVGAMGNEKKTKVGVGNAVAHHSVAIVEFRLEQKLANSEPYQQARGTWIKNQLSDPFGTFVMPIVYGRGVDVEWSDLECARALGMVEVSGAWFEIDCGDAGSHRAQGISKATTMLREHPRRLAGLREKARDFIGKAREVDLDAMARMSKYASPEDLIQDEVSHEEETGKTARTAVVKVGEAISSVTKEDESTSEAPKRGRPRGKK